MKGACQMVMYADQLSQWSESFELFCICSGKSTVGKLVASALKYPFLDSDTLIEQLAGCTISEIFREEGEESFREVESQVLQVSMQHMFFLPPKFC